MDSFKREVLNKIKSESKYTDCLCDQDILSFFKITMMIITINSLETHTNFDIYTSSLTKCFMAR